MNKIWKIYRGFIFMMMVYYSYRIFDAFSKPDEYPFIKESLVIGGFLGGLIIVFIIMRNSIKNAHTNNI